MTLAYKTIDLPVGRLKLVASEKGLVAVLWAKQKSNRVPLREVEKRNASGSYQSRTTTR
jgi:methylated-DNA-[protein]-cysteine S-methyltransferase